MDQDNSAPEDWEVAYWAMFWGKPQNTCKGKVSH